MIAVTGAAAHFRRGPIQQGHNRMICYAAAFHAKIIDNVAQSQVSNHNIREYNNNAVL